MLGRWEANRCVTPAGTTATTPRCAPTREPRFPPQAAGGFAGQRGPSSGRADAAPAPRYSQEQRPSPLGQAEPCKGFL